MSAGIEKRIEALEVSENSADQHLRVVIAEAGETADQALRREDVDAGADNVLVVVFG